MPAWLAERIYFRLLSRGVQSPASEPDPITLRYGRVALPRWVPSDLAHRQMAWLGYYERALTLEFVRLARAGGLCVDAGANIGYYTCLWATAAPGNRVLAFEPSPRVYPLACANVNAAGLAGRVELRQLALGHTTGTLDFALGPGDQTGWGGLALNGQPDGCRVRVDTLDNVCGADTDIAVLKIDTEGADAWVLDGAKDLLRAQRIRHIFFERNHERASALGIDWPAAIRRLEGAGYVVHELAGDNSGTQFHATPGNKPVLA